MPSKLNVIYIITDQHRADALGCYGNEIVKTPNIDSLAKEGTRFTNAFTPSSLCAAARASLLTGLFPISHGVRVNPEKTANFNIDIYPGTKTIPDHIPGYDYIHLGKWHAEGSSVPSDYGASGHDFDGYGFPGAKLYKNFKFAGAPKRYNPYVKWLADNNFEVPTVSESYFGENPNLQIQELYGKLSGPAKAAVPFFLIDEAKKYISDRDKISKPFFLSINFWGPHTPCVLPEPYYSMIDPLSIPEDPTYATGLKGKPIHFTHISKMWGVFDLPWSKWQQIIARYYGYISMIDDAIGELLTFLRDEGTLDDTLIVFTADHGEAMGSHRLIEKGEFMYDTSYKIPMISRFPKAVNAGAVCDEFVYLHDLCPTLGEVASGIAPDTNGESQSIFGLMQGHNASFLQRDHIYAEFTSHFTAFPQRMIRTRQHKFIFNASCEGELYDLSSDPHEINNLIDDPAYGNVKRELMEKLIDQLETLKDPLAIWVKRARGYY